MKVSITMSEIFDWGYNEAETVDRLKALSTVEDALWRKTMVDDLNGVRNNSGEDAWSLKSSLEKIEMSLADYGENKGYDINPYLDHSVNLISDRVNSPLTEAHQRFLAEKREGKATEVTIDESQFEVPNQNQKTL